MSVSSDDSTEDSLEQSSTSSAIPSLQVVSDEQLLLIRGDLVMISKNKGPKLCNIISCLRRLEWVCECVRRSELLLSEETPICTSIVELNRKGWYDLCQHVESVLAALLGCYDGATGRPQEISKSDRGCLLLLDEFNTESHPLYRVLGQPEQGYVMRFTHKQKTRPRNQIRDNIDNMRLYLDWCSNSIPCNGLLQDPNGVPVSLPSHAELACWPDELLHALYQALNVCYMDYCSKGLETQTIQSSASAPEGVDSSMFRDSYEPPTHYESIISRVDGSVLLAPSDNESIEEISVPVLLPGNNTSLDMGTKHREPVILRPNRRIHNSAPREPELNSPNSSAKQPINAIQDSSRLGGNATRGNLGPPIDWVHFAPGAREQMDEPRVKEIWSTSEDVEAYRQQNEVLNPHLERQEAQLRQTELAWSEAVQERDFLKRKNALSVTAPLLESKALYEQDNYRDPIIPTICAYNQSAEGQIESLKILSILRLNYMRKYREQIKGLDHRVEWKEEEV